MSQSEACCMRLLGRRCSHLVRDCKPPGADHSYLLLKDGVPFEFVTHPYGLGDFEVRALVQYCDCFGLSFRIHADGSWWFPGRTIAVILKKGAGPQNKAKIRVDA